MIGTKQNVLRFFEEYLTYKKPEKRDRSSFAIHPNFSVAVKRYGVSGHTAIMPLDDEDLEYLARKYSKILMEEHAENVKTLADGYDAMMGKIKECLHSESTNK